MLVKGRGTYMYDSEGVPYLDCINNVAHLGHGNEEVGWWGGVDRVQRPNRNGAAGRLRWPSYLCCYCKRQICSASPCTPATPNVP